MTKRVLCLYPLKAANLERIRAIPGIEVDTAEAGHSDDLEGLDLSGYDAIIGDPSKGALDRAPRVCWLATMGAGVDHLAGHGLAERDGLTLTNGSGLHGVSMGEHVLGAILFAAQRHPTRIEFQRRRAWDPVSEVRAVRIRGRTVVIVGYGTIGREIGRLAHAFGMRVLAVRSDPSRREDRGFDAEAAVGIGDPEGRIPERIVGPDRLHEVLREADYVVLATPLTPVSRGMIDAAAFAAMKPGAWLVNIARGGLIDEDALLAAIRSGHLAGAHLDAFPHEPLGDAHEFWAEPNIYISQHVAGMNSEEHFWPLVGALMEENVRRFAADEPLINVVDVRRGY
jgi:phosphoglycerate dehydrogenase-like enzyme